MNEWTTKRLRIRPMAETDLQDFLAFQTHPVNLEYVPHEASTEAKAAAFLAGQANREITDEGRYLAFAVELLDMGKMIGEVGLGFEPKDDQPQRRVELGWSLHPDYHGKGYATEAAESLLRYVFQELDLHRVAAGCDARNTASYRLMERLGMRREAHSLQSRFVKGAWRDELVYALLRTEWLLRQELRAS